MKRIVFEVEVFISEAEFKQFQKTNTLVWDINSPLATVFNKPIKIKRAYIDKEYNGKT